MMFTTEPMMFPIIDSFDIPSVRSRLEWMNESTMIGVPMAK